MKKFSLLLVLVTGITAELCAQTTEDRRFEVPSYIVINRRFYVALDHGNRVKIEITDINDLEKIKNVDSLIQVFINDVSNLKDSLSDPLAAKRIDYMTDESGRKRIRIQQFPAQASSFVLGREGELASLRTAQDTLHMIGVITNPLPAQEKISKHHPRYYHLTFYLNNINELGAYMDGRLNTKINTIQQHVNGRWPLVLGSGSHFMKTDRSIVADRPRGFTAMGDYVSGFISINLQNYKNYFVPSFSLGVVGTFVNREKSFKWEPGLLWEPHFFFGKDAQDKLHTYRNDFLTLVYAQGGITNHDPTKDFSFSANFSLGYLIHREGEFIEKNTFRLGAGKLKLSKITVEPVMYFNNFFRGVTPGVRASFRF